MLKFGQMYGEIEIFRYITYFRKPCALAVVAPCPQVLPDHSIYVVHFNAKYGGGDHVPDEIVHMR